MRIIRLREYQCELAVPLTSTEVGALRLLVPSVQVQPTPGQPDHFDLRPGSQVGVVHIGDLAIEIRPKLSIQRVLFLLSFVADHRWWRDDEVPLQEDLGVYEAIIPGFAFQVRRALRRGVLQGYQTREEALALIRGRLRFDDQLRRRYGRLPPAEVRYDEFTEDIEANRLIKAAANRLRRLPLRARTSRRLLAQVVSALATVAEVPYTARNVPQVTYNRLNVHYRPAVELARLILRGSSFDAPFGGVHATTFLIDMNQVFEDFVVVALRERLGLSERTFPQGTAGRRLCLDRSRRIGLEPDVSWWDGASAVFVGDVKYKRTVEGGLNSDIYQALAYAVAADLPGAVLIYAAGEMEQCQHRIAHLDKTIEVLTMDLDGPPSSVLAEVNRVADRVQAWRLRSGNPLSPTPTSCSPGGWSHAGRGPWSPMVRH